MPKTKVPSPARSQGCITTPKRKTTRGSRSMCSPALSTASGRLTSLVDQFKGKNMESFALSPLNGRSVLNDNTEIEEPECKSWWKKLDENSQDLMELLEDNKLSEVNNGIEELIDIEVLSQEKKNYTLDLPESSDSESINSIVLPQRKLFTQKENQPQKKYGHLIDNRESLAKLHKTNTTNIEKTVNVGTRELFQNIKRSKPIFPAALLNISPNKTTADKTKENMLPEPKAQVRNIFGNRPRNKRKNMFADFIVSESEDEITEIQPKVFGFQRKLEQRKISSVSKGRDGSPTSSITTDMEMDDWKLLPSSTMVENQLEDMLAGGTPIKRARLSKLSEAKESEAGTNTIQTNTTGDKTKQSNKSLSSKNKSKFSPVIKDKSLNNSKTILKHTAKREENFDTSIIQDKQEILLNQEGKDEELVYQESDEEVNNSQENVIEENEKEIEIDAGIKQSQEIEEKANESQENNEEPYESQIVDDDDAQIEDENNEEIDNNEEEAANESQINEASTNESQKVESEDIINERTNIAGDKTKLSNKSVSSKNKSKSSLEIKDKSLNNSRTTRSMLKNASIRDENVIMTTEEDEDEANESQEIEAKINETQGIEEEANESQEIYDQAHESQIVEDNDAQDEENDQEMNNEDVEEAENESQINEASANESQEVESEDVVNKKTNTAVDITKHSNKSVSSINKSKSSLEIKDKSLNNSRTTRSMFKNASIREENVIMTTEEDEDEANESQEIETKINETQGIEEEANESQEIYDQAHESQIVEDNDAQDEENDEEINEDEEEADNESRIKEAESQEIYDQAHESQIVEDNDAQDEENDEENNDDEMNEEADNESRVKEASVGEIDEEESHEVESEAEVNESEEIEDDQQMDDSDEADKAIASDPEISDQDDNQADEMEVDDDDENEQESENVDESEQNQDESQKEIQIEKQNEIEPSAEEIEESPNVTHDTTGRHRKKDLNKSLEVILHDKTNQMDSFTAKGRNTSVRKTKSMIKNLNIKPSLAPHRDSTGFSVGTSNSSAEGSGWDSHRTTRKTLRQTFGKDFTPRKSLRALVMEKSAKRQTEHMDVHSVTVKYPLANSTEVPEDSNHHVEDIVESDQEVSRRTRQTTLEMYLQKIKQQNIEKKLKMEEAVRNSLKGPVRDTLSLFKVPTKPAPRRPKPAQSKPKKQIKSIIPFDELPSEVIEDMKYKPPKRFQPTSASWITKRLYKFLENKLEPKYDYKARVRAEKLVETVYHFAKDLRRHDVAPTDAVEVLKHELARLEIVRTHFEFYEFFHEFMPREVRVKVVPDIVNKIPLPRHGVFSDILRGNTVQG